MSKKTEPAVKITDEQLAALQMEYIEADAQALNAKVWASPEYVAEKLAFADCAYATYRKALQNIE